MAVFDIDYTLYDNPDYNKVGDQREIEAVAEILGISTAEVQARQAITREEIVRAGRIPMKTETILALGITQGHFNELRVKVWNGLPRRYFCKDSVLCDVFEKLGQRYTVVFGTNSPQVIGEQIVRAVGLKTLLPRAVVFGADSFPDAVKPAPQFFRRILDHVMVNAYQAVGIGDRAHVDVLPAIAAGFSGGFEVSGPSELPEVITQLLHAVR